jgi:hypothetical protein
MRQALVAGLIVGIFGLPMVVIADGKELTRECGALAAVARGNLAPFKSIWLKPAPVTTLVEQEGELGAIQRWAAWETAQERATPHNATARNSLVFAGFPQLLEGRGYHFSEVAPAPVATHVALLERVSIPQEAPEAGEVPAFLRANGASPRSRFAAFTDEFSIAAYADEMNAERARHAHDATVVAALAADEVGEGAVDISAITASTGWSDIGSATPSSASTGSRGFIDVEQLPVADTGFAVAASGHAATSGLTEIGKAAN